MEPYASVVPEVSALRFHFEQSLKRPIMTVNKASVMLSGCPYFYIHYQVFYETTVKPIPFSLKNHEHTQAKLWIGSASDQNSV